MRAYGLWLVVFFVYIAYTRGQSRPTCRSNCGNVVIEFPFGISPNCYYAQDPNFKLSCNEREKLFYGENIEVIGISHHGQLRVKLNVSSNCINSEGDRKEVYPDYNLRNISLSSKNKFTLVGCDAYALLTSLGNENYTTGCLSYCGTTRPTEHRKCRGEGCCKIDVSGPLKRFRTRSSRFENFTTSVIEYNPCIYAFLVEEGKFEFSSTHDLKNLRSVTDFPVLLDWSIGNETCKQVGNNSICGRNSICLDSTREIGYNCRCSTGYEGNPYIPLGCQDIDECTTTTSIHRHNCSDPKTCENKPGTFSCKCQSGYRLDTTTMSCKRKEFPWPLILLGTIIGILVFLLGVNCIQQRMKYQKQTKLRQQYFEQNGGGMLTQRISGAGPSTHHVDVIIFTEEGMKEATNCYDESRILGQGGQGTVFKGILSDNSIVAIKKARLGDRSQVEQFINEVFVLSQINHRNVVKILGCCLETEVPFLVYEFISNGTLYDHLHGSMSTSALTWECRIRIAIEVAETLAYLHSSISIPIIHRDIKTANILLDDNLTPKVADFGVSRLIPLNKDQLTTVVQGTFGYLDPEYYNTGLLTDKSDVYCFGIVLMELLTGKKPICFQRPPQSKLLVSLFSTAVKHNRLHEVIDPQTLNNCNMREVRGTANVALMCTRPTGETRPDMKRVATELEALRVNTNDL